MRENAWLKKNELSYTSNFSQNLADALEKYEPSGNRINGVVITLTEMSFVRNVVAVTNLQVVSAKKGNSK